MTHHDSGAKLLKAIKEATQICMSICFYPSGMIKNSNKISKHEMTNLCYWPLRLYYKKEAETLTMKSLIC